MGTTPDSHFKSTAGQIPVQLKCQFVVEDAESNVTGLLAFLQTFATGPIRHTSSMVNGKERDRPAKQLSRNGSYCSKPGFSIGTTYMIPITAIQEAFLLLLLTPQPHSSQLYLSTTIHLNTFNLFNM